MAVAVLGLACLPLLALQARLTWGHSHYRFFPLVLLGAGLLGARDGSSLGVLAPGPGRRVRWLLGGSWVLLAGACVLGSAWLGTVAALLATLSVADSLGGDRLLRALLPAWGLLWLAVPPPLGLDNALVTLLQAAATRWSCRMLDLLGVFHLREGNVIRLADRRLLIEEACSGIHSLFAVLAATIFLALWTRRSLGRGLALVATAVTWVFLGNILRIVAVAYLAARWQVDVSSGWRHEMLGLAVFVLALGLTASTDSLFSLVPCVLHLRRAWMRESLIGPECAAAVPEPTPRSRHAPPTRLPSLRRTRLASWPLATAYGALALVQPLFIGNVLEDYFLPGAVVASRLLALRAADLPASWGPFQQQSFETVRRDRGDDNGGFSQNWVYRWGRRTVLVSLDGPFQGWHEMTRCYVGQGWIARERLVQPGTSGAGAIAMARLERPLGREADLLFSNFDARGRVLEPDNFGGRLGLRDELQDFWRRQSRQRTYQVQLFVEGEVPLTSAERSEALAFFERVRAPLVQRVGRGGREVPS
jgi:exosortase